MATTLLPDLKNLLDLDEKTLQTVLFIEKEHPQMMQTYINLMGDIGGVSGESLFNGALTLDTPGLEFTFALEDHVKRVEYVLNSLQPTILLDPLNGVKNGLMEPANKAKVELGFFEISCQMAFSIAKIQGQTSVLPLLQKLYVLFCRKQYNYGSGNIAMNGDITTPEGQHLALIGLWVRCNDKVNRLKNLVINKREDVVGESTLDTLSDLLVYGIIARIVLSGTWGK